MNRPIALVLLVIAASLSLPGLALAQTEGYPNKPVKVIVPFPPGGSVDVVARVVAPKLGEALGQQLVVENRAGASGSIGTEMAARAKPDGYTLMMHTLPFVANVHLYAKVPYDLLGDFAPIALVSSSPSVVVVHPSVSARTVRDLLQMAKAKLFETMGLNIIASTPEEFGAHLKSELDKWGRVIRERRIKGE